MHEENERIDAADRIAVASFADRDDAYAAIDRLRESGYAPERIGFAGHDDEGRSVLVEEHGNASGAGAAGGLVTGAAAGGALAWIGLAAIPVIGPFLAGGAIGTALIGAGAGAITGGILGGLLGLGIPRHKAEYHEEQLRSGRSLVTVQTDDSDATERLLRDAGALDVDVEDREQADAQVQRN